MNQKTKEAYDIQYECIDKIKLLADEWSMQAGRPIVANVTTFGCQMNARDSEKLRGILNKAGFQDTENEDDADIVIYNTCTVRDNANQHVFGRLGHLNGVKRNKKDMIIGLCGCMMQEPHIVEKVKKSYPFVDLIFGTHNLYAFPELLLKVLTDRKRVIDVRDRTEVFPEHLPVVRKYPFKSGVNIMYGCNNFCTYCIVPYVRGREVSRTPEEILAEVKRLADDGVTCCSARM